MYISVLLFPTRLLCSSTSIIAQVFLENIPSQTMRGSTHTTMSIIIFLPTFFFLHKFSTLVVWSNHLNVVLLGIVLGSLLPDLDAHDSKIMHGMWRPFGFLGKNIFYRPLRRLLGHKLGHRKILHSLIGCLLISSFFAIISLALYALFAGALIIWYFWIGIPIGIILHLAEDSFTHSGVIWFYPRGNPISSTTITSGGGEYLLVFYSFILFGSWTSIAYYLLAPSIITALIVIGVSVLLLIGLHRANPRISKRSDSRYSTRDLVEFYLDDVGGKRIKPMDPYGTTLKIEDNFDPTQKQYVVWIPKVGGVPPLKRKGFAPFLDSSTMEEGDIVEMQFFENNKKKRIYFIVEDGTFKAFYKRDF